MDFWTFNPNREGFCLLTLSHVRTLLKIGFEVCSPCLQIKLKIIYMLHRNSHTDPLSQWFSKDPHTDILLILWIPIAYEIVFLWLVLFRIIFFLFLFHTIVRLLLILKQYVGSQSRFSMNFIARL